MRPARTTIGSMLEANSSVDTIPSSVALTGRVVGRKGAAGPATTSTAGTGVHGDSSVQARWSGRSHHGRG